MVNGEHLRAGLSCSSHQLRESRHAPKKYRQPLLKESCCRVSAPSLQHSYRRICGVLFSAGGVFQYDSRMLLQKWTSVVLAPFLSSVSFLFYVPQTLDY